MRRMVLAIGAVAVLAGCGVGGDVEGSGPDEIGQIEGEARQSGLPDGKGIGTLKTHMCRESSKITYHNGALMQGDSNVYLIWYGNWSGNSAREIITELVANLGGSPYFQINTKYKDAQGQGPSGVLFYGGAVDDAYSKGTALSDADLGAVVSAQLQAGKLPVDVNGIYVVLSSAD